MPATPLVRWSYSSSGTNTVDETLVIDEDGATGLWLFAAAGRDRMDRCGTFWLPPSPALADEARGLAMRLGAAPQTIEIVARGGVPLALEAGGAHHQINPASQAARTPEIEEALALAERERSRVLESPVSAIRAAMRVGAARAGAPAAAIFEVACIGTREALFSFEPASFAAFGYTDTGETFTWRAMGSATMGLLDSETLDLVGGVVGQARMAPGQRAVATFVDALEADPGSYKVAGSVSGRMAVLDPGTTGDAFPMRPFRLATPEVSWVAR